MSRYICVCGGVGGGAGQGVAPDAGIQPGSILVQYDRHLLNEWTSEWMSECEWMNMTLIPPLLWSHRDRPDANASASASQGLALARG